MDRPRGLGLEHAIEPWGVGDFLEGPWERRPVLILRADRSHFAGLMSLAEFDEIVATTALRHPYFRVFRAGQLVPVEETTTSRQLGPDLDSGLADLNKLYDEYGDGGTLALQAAERWWPPLRELARDFQEQLGFPAQVHTYLTPGNAQGAPVHYDTHDVFVLQIDGEKSWDVWPPLRVLPMRISEDSYDQSTVNERAKSDPTLSVTLEAGDTLYLPRGYIHRARTGASTSLHVTVSIMVERWIDVARSAVSNRLKQLRDEPSLRRSITFGRAPMEPASVSESDEYQAALKFFLEPVESDLRAALKAATTEGPQYVTASRRGRFVDAVHRWGAPRAAE